MKRLKSSNRDKEKMIKLRSFIPFFVALTPRQFLKAEKIAEEEIKDIINIVYEKEGLKIYSHDELALKWLEVKRFTTGSRRFDSALNGGIQTMRIYEFFGPAGSGKTQICLQLSVNVQLPEECGGLSSKVIYIDTERGFNVKRFIQLCKYRDLNERLALRNVLYANVETDDELLRLLSKAKALIKTGKIKLILIDNISTPFRRMPELDEERLIKLSQVMAKLHELAYEFNLAVVLTNRVYSMPDEIAGEKIRPFGGMVLETAVHEKIELKKQWENIFQAKIMDDLLRTEIFRINERGVEDVT